MFMQVLFWAGNQGKHQNFDQTDFHLDEAKKFQYGQLKKVEFFKTANFQYFFSKISGIGP